MKTLNRLTKLRIRIGATRLLTVALVGCAATSLVNAAKPELPKAEIDPAGYRKVQAVDVPSTGVDGQTSWIIEQDVPRIPKIAGLNGQLPPHIERRMGYAFDLAQRGATYSAAGEFQSVLGLCALELDAADGGTRHREALRQGLIALDEADEFSGQQVDWRETADVRAVAASHTTTVLKQYSNTPVDSIQAVQAYYTFAEERLAFACKGLPGSSLAFYGLGRTIMVPDTQVAHAAGKSALFHRVALIVAPQNVLSGNELGVLFARHGHLEEAERMFQQCVATSPSPETYRNLAAVYARKGDDRSSRAAAASADALVAHDREVAGAVAATTPVGSSEERASEDAESKEKSGFLAKFPFSPKLPSVFRR